MYYLMKDGDGYFIVEDDPEDWSDTAKIVSENEDFDKITAAYKIAVHTGVVELW